jgi:two-component system LytT family sensor kinase
MKRFWLHLSFWAAYTLQDAGMMYSWAFAVLHGKPDNNGIIKAIYAAIVVLVPKIFLAYFLFNVSLPGILKGTIKMMWVIVYTFLALLVTIIIYRILFKYYVFGHIYEGLVKPSPLFQPITIFQALIDIGFATGCAVILKLFRVQLAGKEREKNLSKEKLETELKFLRNQTNPHFLFNTLNNIYGLARKKSDDTAEVVMKLSKLLRFMLYESKKSFIKIGDEMKMLENYINLEKIRYTEKLTIVFDKQIDDETEQIAPLLLLPFVENAFKHGASENRFESSILICAKLQQGLLSFTVENSKEDNISDKPTGNIGLSNVRRQLELMYKEYNLQVVNETAVFKVFLTINLRSYAKI